MRRLALGIVTISATAVCSATGSSSSSRTSKFEVLASSGWCENARSVLLQDSLESSASDCQSRCDREPGCQGFSFGHRALGQPCTSVPTAAVGSCYLWAEECRSFTDELGACWHNQAKLTSVRRLAGATTSASSSSSHGASGGGTSTSVEESTTTSDAAVTRPTTNGAATSGASGKASAKSNTTSPISTTSSSPSSTTTPSTTTTEPPTTTSTSNATTSNRTVPEPWSLRLSQTSCSNMASIKIHDAHVVANESACGKRCNETSGCVGFGFQSRSTAECTAGGSAKGSCYLWNASCKSLPNQCWDDYTMGSPALCSSLSCPVGYSSKTAAVNQHCAGHVCDLAADQDTCCAANNGCNTLACPSGFTLRPDAAKNMCKDTVCTVDNDRDTCCQKVASCTTMTCPTGFKLRSNAASLTCSSSPCDNNQDWAACCVQQAKCSSFSCPNGFAGKVNADSLYCADSPCTSADSTRCCDPIGGAMSAGAPVAVHHSGHSAVGATVTSSTTTVIDIGAFAAHCPALVVTCYTNGLDQPLSHQELGDFVVYRCPGQCTEGVIYGTDAYTPASHLCTAAIFSGVISSGGGFIKARIAPGLPMYTGGFRNGIESLDHGATAASVVLSIPASEDFCLSSASTTTTDMPWGIPWWGWFTICLLSSLLLMLLMAPCFMGGDDGKKKRTDKDRERERRKKKKQYRDSRRDERYAVEVDPLYDNTWDTPPPSNVNPPWGPPTQPMGSYYQGQTIYPGQTSTATFGPGPGPRPVYTSTPAGSSIQFPGGGPPVPVQSFSNMDQRRGSMGSGGFYDSQSRGLPHLSLP
mmetsp:Transcript_49381/g.117489  ORF Transcript_49381/g.117489 Transcript_49381/m.117489 type:complete len:811 (-) Transcript_49381:52-2484(-)